MELTNGLITSPSLVFNENAVYCFRKQLQLKSPTNGILHFSANARYKLWINKVLVAIGPCKGSAQEVYYDTIDLTPFLKEGSNFLEAQVLQLKSSSTPQEHRYLCSVYRTGGMHLAAWGNITEKSGDLISIHSDESWLCRKEEHLNFSVPQYAFYAGLNELYYTPVSSPWAPSVVIAPITRRDQRIPLFYGEVGDWFMSPRPIPMMTLIPCKLQILKSGIYDAGELTTGMIHLKASGRGSIKLIYGECFIHMDGEKEIKSIRDDESGIITGDYDIIQVDGATEFESFWFKTFRYVSPIISGDVKIEQLDYIDVHYPMSIPQDYDFGTEVDNALWDISIRTLQRCMHETYEDCPYYEQLQYVYDTSLEMLYTYQLTPDDRLARKLMHDFAQSYSFGNTIQSRFPSSSVQYITQFPMFFIFMVITHFNHFGDLTLVKDYLPVIDGILLWYQKLCTPDGFLGRTIFWEYVDWSDGWEDNRGCPSGTSPLTISNMLYISALHNAAELNRVCKRFSTAEEYDNLATELIRKVNENCFDYTTGLYRDCVDPQEESFSQHPQIWAVLNDMLPIDQAKELLIKSFSLKARATFGYTYFLARALERVGMYDRVSNLLDPIRELPSQGCTTIPETPHDARSECHGWGSIAIYEFTALVLGVKIQDVLQRKVQIAPYIQGRDFAQGSVSTPWGYIKVHWMKQCGSFTISCSVPENLQIELRLPNGTYTNPSGTNFTAECTINS